MKDPFSTLKHALQPIFHLEPMRKGRYVFPEIYQLSQALDRFASEETKRNFVILLRSLRNTFPRIEKWHISFNTIKLSVDQLARHLNMPKINWDTYLTHSNASPKFQFHVLHQKHAEPDLLPWLTAKTGASNFRPNTLTRMLIEYKEHFGFSQKLSAHLKKEPDFLFRLIIESEKNFIQIASTRLVLYLTDQQLAEAIIKHASNLVPHHSNIMIQATKLIAKLNDILSNGRSVSTLLRNTEAKFILEGSVYFQIYQNGLQERNQHAEPIPSPLEEGIMPFPKFN